VKVDIYDWWNTTIVWSGEDYSKLGVDGLTDFFYAKFKNIEVDEELYSVGETKTK
jgi:hypothetical protein